MLRLSLLLVLFPSLAFGQLSSGPSAGKEPAELKVHAVTGDDAGQEVIVTAKRASQPTIYCFVQADKFDRPVGRFLKVLDQELAKNRTDVAVYAVWLSDQPEEAKEYLARVDMSLQLTQTVWAVFPGDKNGPAGWDLSPRAHLTAVIVENGRVSASEGFVSLNETNVPAIVEKLKAKQ